MKTIIILTTFLLSFSSFAVTNNHFFIQPSESATGCDYRVMYQPKNGEKFVHIYYENPPMNHIETSLQECINAALTTSSFEGDGYSVQIQHGSLHGSTLEIVIRH